MFRTALNEDQRAAVRKLITAKDYALLLGMPGTGARDEVHYNFSDGRQCQQFTLAFHAALFVCFAIQSGVMSAPRAVPHAFQRPHAVFLDRRRFILLCFWSYQNILVCA